MKFIEEIVVESFLPTYRSMLAEALQDRGLTQEEIAMRLGISQSAVSKYAHGEVNRHEPIETHDRVGALVERVADGMASSSMSPVQALIEAEIVIRELETGDVLSDLHREAVPGLAEHPESLSIHDPGGRILERERVLAALRGALARLERTAGFGQYIPQVGTNLVYGRQAIESIDDIAGVPGRILNVKGRATVPADPEFGVSEHVASVVLAAADAGSDARAAINLRFDPALMHVLEANGYRSVEIDPTDAVREPVRAALASAPETRVIYHDDGVGIEANTYILGETPDDVVDTVRTIIDET